MELILKSDGWWIRDTDSGEEFGPYQTKELAHEDKRGIERTRAHENDWRWFTCEPKPKAALQSK